MSRDVTGRTAPESVSELLARMDTGTEALPKRLRQCAGFTRRHLHLLPVSTVSEMAQASGVAPSVYMRFCQAYGFSGYSEMQSLFREKFTEFRPNYEERLAQLSDGGRTNTGRLLADFAEAGHKSLLNLANSVTSEELERIAQQLAKARVVHLVGLRRAFPVVANMSYLFDKLGVPANLHVETGLLNMAQSILPGDVLFAVTFYPFSEETVRLVEAAAAKGIPVFALSDSESCPLAEFTEVLMIAREEEVAGFRSLNAPITLTTTLAVSVKAVQELR